MRTETLPSRAAGVATATMLMALVALAAAASAAPGPQTISPGECRAAVMESQAVRAVAAAVAAVARDLLGVDVDGASNAMLPSTRMALSLPAAAPDLDRPLESGTGHLFLTGAARAGLLDLPPPSC